MCLSSESLGWLLVGCPGAELPSQPGLCKCPSVPTGTQRHSHRAGAHRTSPHIVQILHKWDFAKEKRAYCECSRRAAHYLRSNSDTCSWAPHTDTNISRRETALLLKRAHLLLNDPPVPRICLSHWQHNQLPHQHESAFPLRKQAACNKVYK